MLTLKLNTKNADKTKRSDAARNDLIKCINSKDSTYLNIQCHLLKQCAGCWPPLNAQDKSKDEPDTSDSEGIQGKLINNSAHL